MGDLLKEAIADAKAVRETALANAKMALEEAFTPQLKSMLSAKLREDDEEFEDEEADEEEFGGEEEAYEEDEEFGEEEPEAEEEFGEEEPEVDESKIIEIDGVKYAPIVSEDDEEGEEEFGDEEEESDLDLEAIIRELEDELSEDEASDEDTVDEADKSDEDTVDEADKSDDETVDEAEKSDEETVDESDKSENEEEVKEEYEIDESLFKEDEDEETVDEAEKSDEDTSEIDEIKAELGEYKEAVSFLKDKLHEVNILNAKLLFTNKLFKEFALDNNQKLKVVETFDRAQSTREIKLVYSTLAEQFGDNGSITKKHSIKESASKKSGSTKPSKESRKVITEEDQVAARFKKLANIL